jgi:hypothetical protein
MSIESRDDEPTSSEVINLATLFGIVLALCILAMSIGLIRSETANDLRVLTADLLVSLIGMPAVAAATAWLLAGRNPASIARQPME